MKYIKLNNLQAKEIAGKEDDFNANDPRFIENNFFIVILDDLLPIAKRNINELIRIGKVKIIDMTKKTEADPIKIKEVSNQTLRQSSVRIKSRITIWDYTKVEIDKL